MSSGFFFESINMKILSIILFSLLLTTSCRNDVKHDMRLNSNRVEVFFLDFLVMTFAPWSDQELIRLAPVKLVLTQPKEIAQLISSLPNQCKNNQSTSTSKMNLRLLINYYHDDKLFATDRFSSAEFKLFESTVNCRFFRDKSEGVTATIKILQSQATKEPK